MTGKNYPIVRFRLSNQTQKDETIESYAKRLEIQLEKAEKARDLAEDMKKRAEEKGFTFPYLIDEKQEVYPKFGATKTPHVFVLQKGDGLNIVEYIGAIDDNYKDPNAVTTKYVEEAVDAMLNGKMFKEKETKAIGCSIKV